MFTTSAPSGVLAVPTLELDWERRRTDGLVHGLSRVSVPMSGGSDRTWDQLVGSLQRSSTSDSTASDAFHLVAADRWSDGATLELGVHTGYSDAAALHTRLALAVDRANRLS